MTYESLSAFDMISPLDARYYGNDPDFFQAVHPYLSEEATLRYQIKVEQALLAELEAKGVAPAGTSALVAEAVDQITAAEIYKEEEETHHNIRAIVNCIRRRLPARERGYVHLFATSNDIMDSARAVALKDLLREVLLPDLIQLVERISDLALRYANTPQIGRTHGRHAVPLTLGYWLANYVSRLGQRIEFLSKAGTNLRGNFSGAVGAHNSFSLQWADDPAIIEEAVLARLGLRPAENSVSTQVVQPEYVCDFAHGLVSTMSVFANLADDYRNLMRSEIEEIGEDGSYRVGSSTMRHKVNPKNFENVKSLWKTVVPRMTTVYMDQISEHQRDLTNSASGRFLNELAAIVCYACRRLNRAIAETQVNEDAISSVFAQGAEWTIAEPLYIALALAGDPDPYETSKSIVEKARAKGVTAAALLRTDPEAQIVLESLRAEHREIVTDPTRYLGDAPSRTQLVCDDWRQRLSSTSLIRGLTRPREAETLVLCTVGSA